MQPDDLQMERELAALDAALEGRPVEDDLLEWAALAVAVRDERPEPHPAFTAQLDTRVRNGFAGSRPKERRRWLPSFVTGPAAGYAAVVATLVVLVAGIAQLPNGGDDEESAGGGASYSTAPETAGRDSSGGGGTQFERDSAAADESASGGSLAAPAPARPPASDQALRRAKRKVERSASLTLAAPVRELDDVANGVIGVTDRFRGVVLRSSVSSTDAGGTGSFVLRVPVARLDGALAALSQLADVRSRTQASDDITGSFVDAREALEDARTERRRLLEQLEQAITPNETAAIRARLRLVSREIAGAKARVARVDRRASFATVEVLLEADDAAADDEDGAGVWTPGDAWGDALRVLQVALGVLLIALAVAIPLLLVAVPLWLALRMATRRRREAALDV